MASGNAPDRHASADAPAPPGPVPTPEDDDGIFQTRYREVTVLAMVFAIVIGIVMNAAITYTGLKIGFTITGSAIAAVLGFGVLRGVLRKGSILETNIAQTVASAVNTSNSGVIFTVPVLLLLGYDHLFSLGSGDFWLITLACVGGAVLGTAFIIPLRKQMLDIERLRFPSPTAVASILKSPGAGPAKAVVLLFGAILGAAIFFPTEFDTFNWPGLGAIPVIGTGSNPADGWLSDDTINLGPLLGIPPQFQLIFAIAPFALGAGYLTGPPGLYVLAGGILAYLFLNPLAYSLGWMPATIGPEGVADFGFRNFNRPLGIGLLLGGALMGVLVSFPAIKEALKSIAAAGKLKGGGEELGLKTLAVAAVLGFAFLYLAADIVGNRPINVTDPVSGAPLEGEAVTTTVRGYTIGFASDQSRTAWQAWDDARRDTYLAGINARPGWLSGLPPHVRSLIIALVGVAWIWFAGIIIAQCTGMTDWSPISGLALLTVVLVLLLAGSGAVVGAVLIGAALCVAITLAADMMGDLKTGHLVGAQPKRQQVTEILVVWIGPVVTMMTILIIAAANMRTHGVPLGPGTDTAAPQAQALQAVIVGFQGGDIPYALYGAGSLLGVLLGLGAFSGLGVLVGLSMYLPFYYISTYGIGCLINIAVARFKGKAWAEDWGVPLCAGLIVGESVLALVINIIVMLR
jgi:uncharacterized oligopeptide transporter (OPT) family protein